MFAYDLVGFQSENDLLHFSRYVQAEAGAVALGGNRFRAFHRTVRAGAFPIGIDVDEFAALTHAQDARDMYERMKEEYSRRKLLLGVERLDYSKGLPQRLKAFETLLKKYPENIRSATLIQIASPSREDMGTYTDLLQELESLCGATNGNFGELDWMPIRYIHRNVARKRLPGLYRVARVALVTPLRDGMNLVAKEFIAAQDPADPGVLVLSRFAGAAEQLEDALLVNPYDIDGTADTIQRALQMPLEERQARHQKLLKNIREHDVHWWRREFLNALGYEGACLADVGSCAPLCALCQGRLAGVARRLLTFLCFAKRKVSKRKGDPGCCVPPLRYGQPAVLGSGGVSLNFAFGSNNAIPDPPEPALLGASTRGGGGQGIPNSRNNTEYLKKQGLAVASPCLYLSSWSSLSSVFRSRSRLPRPGWAEERRDKRIRAGVV